MATLNAADISDMVKSTLRELGRMKFQQIAQDIQWYEIMGRWLKKDRVTMDDGYGIQKNIMTDTLGAASHVGLFETDDTDVGDHVRHLQVPWRHIQTKWAFEYRETLMNRGKSLIYNIIKPRRAGAMIDLAQELEDNAWAVPNSSDNKLPYGIPYWIVANATTGFNGGNPTGPDSNAHSTTGNIDADTYTTWKNYTAQYTDVTKNDLIKKLRTAHRKINFRSPVDINDYRTGNGQQYRLYTNEAQLNSIETLGENQNENLGRDIASMDGTIVFRKHPIVWIPKLDGGTSPTNPIYMINHSCFQTVVLKGDYLRESDADKAPHQHNTFQVFVDMTYNYCCVDRRRQAVLVTSTS